MTLFSFIQLFFEYCTANTRMNRKIGLLIALCLPVTHAGRKYERRFPEDFLLGVSTSAYQVEGGWNADGKGVSMWDHYLHKQPSLIRDRTNGDVAADSYHLYKRDVELLKELGVKSYRFSVSWTRILPNGTTDYINPYGIAYYNNLIDELLANDIIPFITLYHWDLPIDFCQDGAWVNEKNVDRFGDYARVVFDAFGDRVKFWTPINEPNMHCYTTYGLGIFPPFIKSPGIGRYDCGRNLLLAHARAYRIYNEEFRALQGGKLGLVLDYEWPLAATDSKDDAEAVEDFHAFYLGQFMDPIFKGGYPQRFIDRVAKASARQGYNSSRLRPFTKQQQDYINGTADFVALNHYTSRIVYRNASVKGMHEIPSFEDDTGFGIYADASWPKSAFEMVQEFGPGFYSVLVFIKETYGNPVIYVTENGFAVDAANGLNDNMKVNYHRNYIYALLDAIAAGVNVQGYFIWTLLDTFEWLNGYVFRFGLYQVDTNDPARPRSARKSALFYKEVIRTRSVDYNLFWQDCPYSFTFIMTGTAVWGTVACIALICCVIIFAVCRRRLPRNKYDNVPSHVTL